MRVLEPHYFQNAPRRKKPRFSKRRLIRLVAILIISASASYVVFGQKVDQPSANDQPAAERSEAVETSPRQLRQFTAEAFREAYSAYFYPNTEPIASAPVITGDETADARIRRVAEARGYKLTALPVSSIVKTNEPGLEGDDLMQPNALAAWQDMKAAAVADKIPLKLTSAYRSIDYQRALFLRRMQNTGVNVYTILDGNADDELDAILARAAPPGYSRHHTGYTIDLSCNGVGLEAFVNTACYKWLSQNNFENVKKFGWVPGYPEGVGNQGPEPETWEFIWIGTARTYQ